MSIDDYRRALEAAVAEYEALGSQRRELDARLTQLAHTIGTLNRLCGFVPTVPWGLTDACRLVLRNVAAPLTPTEVRDRLQSIGFDLSKYANELAAIHTVLKRLRESGEVHVVPRAADKNAYIATNGPRTIAMTKEDVHNMLKADEPPGSPKRPKK
jgi:hypothetical protein